MTITHTYSLFAAALLAVGILTEPFEPFTFSPVGAAVYQLGPFGTAAKKLKAWELKP